MAVTITELRKLQRQLNQLQKRVTELEKTKGVRRRISSKPSANLSERERAIQLLKRAGIARDLTEKEKRLAARWDTLSASEKKQVRDSLRAVRIDPPLSKLVHEMR